MSNGSEWKSLERGIQESIWATGCQAGQFLMLTGVIFKNVFIVLQEFFLRTEKEGARIDVNNQPSNTIYIYQGHFGDI